MPLIVVPTTFATGYDLPSPPAVQDGQLEWVGVLFGVGTPLTLSSMEGWLDAPGLDGSDVGRPASNGEIMGSRYLQGRVVTATFEVGADVLGDEHRSLMRTAASVLVPQTGGDPEQPLTLRLGDAAELVFARLERRAIPLSQDFGVGAGQVVVQWKATDPRRYDVLEQKVVAGLPSRGTGVTYPWTYPTDYHDAAPGDGDALATVGGSVPTPPTMTLRGSCSEPLIVNSATGRRLQLDLTLTDSDAVTIDTRDGTVTLNGTANRTGSVTSDSDLVEDFLLTPGDNPISLRSGSGGSAVLTVAWRDATI